MSETRREACATCKWGKPDSDWSKHGRCMFNPPAVIVWDGLPSVYRPWVAPEDFCSHWELNIPPLRHIALPNYWRSEGTPADAVWVQSFGQSSLRNAKGEMEFFALISLPGDKP